MQMYWFEITRRDGQTWAGWAPNEWQAREIAESKPSLAGTTEEGYMITEWVPS